VSSRPHNENPNCYGVIVTATIIALAGIAIVATASLLLVQSASATDDLMTITSSVGGEQEAASSTTGTTNNNVSNAALGSLFMIVEFETASVNPINETYIEISTVNNVTIMPPNATTGMTINATETVNATINILPNGLALDKGQSLIVTDRDDGAVEQENATTAFVDISRMNPDGTGSGTGVVFFSTNSIGQLAFLDNMIGISQSEFSSEGGTIRTWEWKGGTVPFETGGSAPTMGNNLTTITSALERAQEAASSTTNTTNNNTSNAALGSLFSFGEGTEATVNPINETYSVISYSGNRIIMPPNAPDVVINATETGNFILNIQPNGLSIEQGQGFIVTEEDGATGAAEEEENATLTFVSLSRTNPDGTGSGTAIAFFSTNSTGQLAFLDNLVAIGQTEFSPEGSFFREWEWKGRTLPFANAGDGATTTIGNQTTLSSTL
jgi:hypothetical protein